MDRRKEKLLPEGLEAADALKGGYEAQVRHDSWRVAVITYAERFDRKNICRLESRRETDEVFVLMTGKATLFIGREGVPTELEPWKVYNVKQAVWHGICVSPDAKVLICENDDTGPDNTDYMAYRQD